MPTLNSIADRIANMVGQPYNRELKERAKDMVKDLFANRIRQSVERHGIDDQLKLSFIVPIVELNITDILPYNKNIIGTTTVLGTENKLPVPIRVFNDAPFLFVGSVSGEHYTYISSIAERQFRPSLFPTGDCTSYTTVNSKLLIFKSTNIGELVDKRNINEVLITGIWRDPEEILTMYEDIDGQDVEIPFPADMFTNIVYELVRSEFNATPKELDIKLNNQTPVQQ